MRAFFSHSSFDKDFVAAVFEEVGPGRSVYDVRTFKRNADLPLQIREGLEGAEIYVLFLSAAAVRSGWVSAELDLAEELRTQWKIKNVLVFQLDDTRWDSLPHWAQRYVVSCPPSPKQVALRILDEIRSGVQEGIECHGREGEVREIISELSERDRAPAFIYLSGPVGIGRRTLISAVFSSYYRNVSRPKIEISVEQADDLIDIYRRVLPYSANWRVREYTDAVSQFGTLPEEEKATVLAALLKDVSVASLQVVVINAGRFALNEDGKPKNWFRMLSSRLEPSEYPYVWFLSQRSLDEGVHGAGLYISVRPISEEWSRFLFKVLIKRFNVDIPSKDEQRHIENSVSGHPGLILLVASYLKSNPAYKPNRTHNSIVKMVSEVTKDILSGFIGGDVDRSKAVAFFAEVNVLSYEEIGRVALDWPEFERCTSDLIDAGLVERVASEFYSLVAYVQRAAESYVSEHRSDLAEARKTLISGLPDISEDTYLPVNLLDERIVEHIVEGLPIDGVLSRLVMPSQQIRAARKRYDAQDYSLSLKFSKEAYDQSAKLSENGRREAWRLIGLSAIRLGNSDEFRFFTDEYSKSLSRDEYAKSIFNFGNGLKCRMAGDLRGALSWYEKIPKRYLDNHVNRELAYVYAFERSFDRAYSCITRVLEGSLNNPYVLDIYAMVLLERYRIERSAVSVRDIDYCLDNLRSADEREGTNFHRVRSKMRDVFVDNDASSLLDLYVERRGLPVAAKVALLAMLSLKGKDVQYGELRGELVRYAREQKNSLVEIEVARVHVEHLCYLKDYDPARRLLLDYKARLTERCVDDLLKLFPIKGTFPVNA